MPEREALADLEDEMRRLLVERHGVPPGRIRPDARLAEDLLMDGDDARAFVAEIERRTGADFGPLWREWDGRFNPEGFGPRAGFVVLAVAAGASALVLPALPIAEVGDVVKGFAVVAAVLGALALSVPLGAGLRRLRPRLQPTTLAEVATAARRGSWDIGSAGPLRDRPGAVGEGSARR
jgi:hypothetical protein